MCIQPATGIVGQRLTRFCQKRACVYKTKVTYHDCKQDSCLPLQPELEGLMYEEFSPGTVAVCRSPLHVHDSPSCQNRSQNCSDCHLSDCEAAEPFSCSPTEPEESCLAQAARAPYVYQTGPKAGEAHGSGRRLCFHSVKWPVARLREMPQWILGCCGGIRSKLLRNARKA